MRRSAIVTLVVIVAVAIAWFAAWRAIAGRIEASVEDGLANATSQGYDIECTDRAIGGFPLRLTLRCKVASASDSTRAVAATAAGLRVGSLLYRPWQRLVEIVAPVRLSVPMLASPVELDWSRAEIVMEEARPMPNEIRLAADNVQATAGDLAAKASEIDARAGPPQSGNGSEISLLVRDISIEWPGGKSQSADVSLNAAAGAALDEILTLGSELRDTGFSLAPLVVRLETGDAVVLLQGPVSVDADGVLNGDLRLLVAGIETLPPFIASLPPDAQPAASTIAGAAMAFGQAAKLDERDAHSLAVTIENGVVRMGAITVGAIPPLF